MRIFALLTASFLVTSAFAQTTESPEQLSQATKHCTIGDVTSALQAFEIALNNASDFPADIKIAGLGGSVNCQFRFFLPQKPTNGERFTFCEDDVFLGGVVWFVPYEALGVSRELAIEEELEQLESTVFFGPIAGAQPEQSLMRIANKNYVDADFGNVVYTQEAFITQEEPGTYVSNWTAFFMGAPFFNVVVNVDVVTHEEHLNRVENGTWRSW